MRQAVRRRCQIVQQNDAHNPDFFREGLRVHNPRQVCCFDAVANHWAGHAEGRCNDLVGSAVLGGLANEVNDNVVEPRIVLARKALLEDGAQAAILCGKQGEVAFRSPDVAGQNHPASLGLRGALAPEELCGSPEISSAVPLAGRRSAAAAWSTRNARFPSGTITSCAGSGGSSGRSRTSRSVSAFSAPATRNSTRCAAFSTGNVSVIRRFANRGTQGVLTQREVPRSEERRVGKECRSRW